MVTNAHVVAGEDQTAVELADGSTLDADVVAFDPERDLAVLRTQDGGAPGLPLRPARVGDSGGVFGHPGGGPLDVSPFRVGDEITAVGRDIYDSASTSREVLVLASELAPGDSGLGAGRPLGQVIGVAFAVAPDKPAWPTRWPSRSCRRCWSATCRPSATPAAACCSAGQPPIRRSRRSERAGRAGRPDPWGQSTSMKMHSPGHSSAASMVASPGWHDGEALGTTGVGEHLVALLDVGQAVVKQGEHVRRSLRTGRRPCRDLGRSRPSYRDSLLARWRRGRAPSAPPSGAPSSWATLANVRITRQTRVNSEKGDAEASADRCRVPSGSSSSRSLIEEVVTVSEHNDEGRGGHA